MFNGGSGLMMVFTLFDIFIDHKYKHNVPVYISVHMGEGSKDFAAISQNNFLFLFIITVPF